MSEPHSDFPPTWDVAELPEPKPLGLRNLAGLIGPGIVMCGIQIGGGEWLFGPAITARYGGGLMCLALVVLPVPGGGKVYNMLRLVMTICVIGMDSGPASRLISTPDHARRVRRGRT